MFAAYTVQDTNASFNIFTQLFYSVGNRLKLFMGMIKIIDFHIHI